LDRKLCTLFRTLLRTFFRNIRKMNRDTSWIGEKFSRSREPRDAQSSSPPPTGLSPRKMHGYDVTSMYDETEGDGAPGLTPLTGDISAANAAGGTAQDESSGKEKEGSRGTRPRVPENPSDF
jgi:hypothetical protein